MGGAFRLNGRSAARVNCCCLGFFYLNIFDAYMVQEHFF